MILMIADVFFVCVLLAIAALAWTAALAQRRANRATAARQLAAFDAMLAARGPVDFSSITAGSITGNTITS